MQNSSLCFLFRQYDVIVFLILISLLAVVTMYTIYSFKCIQKFNKILDRKTELLNAFENREFLLYYQPIVNALDNKIVKLEALIRWKHPEKGFLLPNKFIDDVEDHGMMNQIGKWVLNKAVSDYKEFMRMDAFKDSKLIISVNVSYSQFEDSETLKTIESLIKHNNLPRNTLCIEVTEKICSKDEELLCASVKKLKEIGCIVVLDDFGMEYSTLSTLKKIDYDIYKIDKYFIDDLVADRSSEKITGLIIDLAHTNNKKAIAEGVETKQQVEKLISMGCHLMQGFYFARPMSVEDMCSFVKCK